MGGVDISGDGGEGLGELGEGGFGQGAGGGDMVNGWVDHVVRHVLSGTRLP